jgi:hypothetical protein
MLSLGKDRCDVTVPEHPSHHLKIKGLSPAAVAYTDTGREKNVGVGGGILSQNYLIRIMAYY